MYVVREEDMIFVYRDMDLFLQASKQDFLMLYSDYAIQVMDSNFKHGIVMKDRSGIFRENAHLPIQTLLKLIEMLYEDSGRKNE